MKRLTKIIPVLLVGITLSCSKPEIDSSGFPEAVAVSENVMDENVMDWVYLLSAAHHADTKVSNEGFPPANLFPSADLSRDSAVGIVASAFESMGYHVDTIALGEEPQVAYNLVAEWPGNSMKDQVVLVGAHLDAFYDGADDNTSAVAAMIEAARAIRQQQFKRTIRFVAFDLEEFGSIGSTRYFEAGYANDVSHAIVMDMMGYASSEPNSQKDILGVKVPHVGDYLCVIGNRDSEEITQKMVNLCNGSDIAKLVGIIAPGDGTYFLSSVFMRTDHALFWYNGIPAIFLTDGANFRNPHYHLESDTPETLNPDFLIRNTKALTATIALIAEVNE